MADKLEKYKSLSNVRRLAAFGVVGAAKVIFESYPISETLFKCGVEALKQYEQAEKALLEFDWEEPK